MNLYYSVYIDLLRAEGVGSSFLEKDGVVIMQTTSFRRDTTINELSLIGILTGLDEVPDGADVDIIGTCKYADQALKKLKTWITSDEIDLKAHSHHLRRIWDNLIKKGKVNSYYYASRRSEEMLWPTSQAAIWHYQFIQDKTIQTLAPVAPSDWRLNMAFPKDKFITYSYPKRPYNDYEMEKAISKRRKELLQEKALEKEASNIIQFPVLTRSKVLTTLKPGG